MKHLFALGIIGIWMTCMGFSWPIFILCPSAIVGGITAGGLALFFSSIAASALIINYKKKSQ